MRDGNNVSHLFAKKVSHEFSSLVEEFGSQENLVRQILTEANGRINMKGVTDIIVKIKGQKIRVTGVINDGIFKVGSFWKP